MSRGCSVKKAHPRVQGIVGNLCYACGTYSAFRNIYDPGDCQIVIPIVHGFQITQDILDLFSGVEIHSAHDVVRDVVFYEMFLKHSGLGVGTVQHGAIVIFCSFPYPAHDLGSHELSFFKTRVKLSEQYLLSGFPVGPQSLFFSAVVMCYDAVGRI